MKKILHSKILGKGDPLFILHGYLGMGDNWKTLGNKFSKDYQVHLIDQRNHGRSFQTEDFNYQLLSEDLYSYMEYHKIEKANIIGHSMGGKTAMFFATAYPLRTNKIIVVDIAPKYYSPRHNDILEALGSVDFSIQKTRDEVKNKIKKTIKNEDVCQFLLKNIYWKKDDELGFRFYLKSLTNNNEKIGETLHKRKKYHGDILFIKGEKSNYITPNDQKLMQSHFPKYKMVNIKKVGHWLHVEKPEIFYTQVIDFFSKRK